MIFLYRFRFALLLVIFILSYVTASSQAFRGGFLAGVSTSQVTGDGYGGFNKAGLEFGAFVNTKISEKMLAQFEIEFIQKGSRKNPDSGSTVVDRLILRMDYVQVPILLKYYQNSFYIEGGLYAGLLLNFYMEDENGEITDYVLDGPFKPIKSTDFGYLMGLGYEFKEHYALNTRFSNSITNVKEYESGAQRWLDSGWRHIVVSFYPSVHFLNHYFIPYVLRFLKFTR